MLNLNELDDKSRDSVTIKVKEEKEENEKSFSLKPKFNLETMKFKLKKGDNFIILYARLIHIINRFAHTYNHKFNNMIYDVCYGKENSLNERIQKIKSKEFKKIAKAIETYCTEYNVIENTKRDRHKSSLNLLTAKRKLEDALTNDGLNTTFNADLIMNLTMLMELKKNCYRIKELLIIEMSNRIKNENLKSSEKYSYGIKRITTTKENSEEKLEDVFVINVPKYGQFVFHFMDEEIYSIINEEYDDSLLPIIRIDYKNNGIQAPIPTCGLSDELQEFINSKDIETIMGQIYQASNSKEEARRSIFNLLLNKGEKISKIKEYLQQFDEKYSTDERE